MVVHRAAERTAEGERVTMANSYVASDMSTNDQSRSAHLISVDDPELFWAEWARFAAWRSAGRLQLVISDLPFGSTVDQAASALEHAIADAPLAVSPSSSRDRALRVAVPCL